ncbi:Imm10 family immunity protein [Streptosporangium sp. NPDC049644]|uniref:Imm10 family immunity protein n=1 Tax=Streptosporangium sp. NPDC049644 TaxID=3155507 RepID=UPI003432292B
MTIIFTAQAAGADEDLEGEFLSAGVSETQDGDGMMLIFQCCTYEPDDQDIALGMDTHCVITANQGTAYGAVREIRLSDNVLRVVFDPDDLEALGLAEPEVEVALDVDQESVEQLRQGLRRILSYGRADARPHVLNL